MKQKFTAEIQKHEGIDGAYVEIPFDVEAVFGAKRVKVLANFDGREYRGSIVRMSGCYMLGLTQALRKEIGKNPGDLVTVEVEKDEKERVIEIPQDLLEALKDSPDGLEFLEKMSYSQRKDYVQWITDAKKEETRKARIQKAVIMLKDKKKLK